MAGRFAVGRWEGPGVAAGALVGYRQLGMVPAAGLPSGGVVASDAVGRAHRDVSGALAGGAAAIVAARAVGRCGEAAVIDLGPQPTRGGFVAVLAHRLPCVHGGGRLDAGMAGRALGCDRDAGVQLGWGPGRVACLVAAVAVGGRQTRHSLVRRVAGRLAVGRREGPRVAAGALVRYRELRVIPEARLPSDRGVTGNAVKAAHRDVSGALAGGAATVVAAGAIGRDGEAAVVDLGSQPAGGGLVAVLAHGLACVHRSDGLGRS